MQRGLIHRSLQFALPFARTRTVQPAAGDDEPNGTVGTRESNGSAGIRNAPEGTTKAIFEVFRSDILDDLRELLPASPDLASLQVLLVANCADEASSILSDGAVENLCEAKKDPQMSGDSSGNGSSEMQQNDASNEEDQKGGVRCI